MNIIKGTVDKVLTVVAAVSAPVIALLTDQHAWAPSTGLDVAAIVAAIVAGYHGGSVAQAKLSSPAVTPLD